MADTDALLDVTLPPGPPAASLRLDARTIELQARYSARASSAHVGMHGVVAASVAWVSTSRAVLCVPARPWLRAFVRPSSRSEAANSPLQGFKNGKGGGGMVSVRLLELSTGGITLHCAVPGVEEHDLATTAGLQVGAGRYLRFVPDRSACAMAIKQTVAETHMSCMRSVT